SIEGSGHRKLQRLTGHCFVGNAAAEDLAVRIRRRRKHNGDEQGIAKRLHLPMPFHKRPKINSTSSLRRVFDQPTTRSTTIPFVRSVTANAVFLVLIFCREPSLIPSSNTSSTIRACSK